MNRNGLNQQFFVVFDPIMTEQRFLRKGLVYHRIVNGEIVQLLSIKKFSGFEYTIQFLVFPLCIGVKYTTFRDDNRMCESFKDVDSWEYNTDEYVQQMPLVLQQVKEHLFPLFDSITTYQKYWQHYHSSLHLRDDRTYILSLLLGEYDVSKQSREFYIEQRIKTNILNWGTEQFPVESIQNKFELTCREYERMKKAMDENDRGYIEAYIRKNEQESLSSYVKAFCTPKKYNHYIETGSLPFEFVTV